MKHRHDLLGEKLSSKAWKRAMKTLHLLSEHCLDFNDKDSWPPIRPDLTAFKLTRLSWL